MKKYGARSGFEGARQAAVGEFSSKKPFVVECSLLEYVAARDSLSPLGAMQPRGGIREHLRKLHSVSAVSSSRTTGSNPENDFPRVMSTGRQAGRQVRFTRTQLKGYPSLRILRGGHRLSLEFLHLKLVSAFEPPGELLEPIPGMVGLPLRSVKDDHFLTSHGAGLRKYIGGETGRSRWQR